jgi:putative flippase GtrA
MLNKFSFKDLIFCVVTGLVTGVAGWLIIGNLGMKSPFLPFLIIIVPVLWIIGVNFGYFLGKWMPFFNQFGRFAAVGFTNAAVDFGVLNILSALTGITGGGQIIPLNAISFTAAVICSYYLNKFWVFDDNAQAQESRKFSLFIIVSVIGIAINSGVVYLMTTVVHPQFGLAVNQWLNIAKILASAVGLIWNFAGYKLIVFKK